MGPLKSLRHTIDPRVDEKFASYPPHILPKMKKLRELIVQVANETESVTAIEETLKWGEPSYLTKKGSTLRMDWKEKNPEQYALYFKCTSKLIPTIKEVYGTQFNYETTRAIVFGLEDDYSEKDIKECIRLALEYHLLKDQALMGLDG